MGVDRTVYKDRRFEPIVQPREFIQTFPDVHFYKVAVIYTLPWLGVDVCDNATGHLNAPLAFNVQSRIFELPDVYLDDGELAQYRFIPREDFVVTWIGKPRARPLLTIKNATFAVPTYYIDPRTNPANEYLQLNEIFQFEDTGMFAQVTCVNPLGLAAAHLDFFGYRFILNEVAEGEIPAKVKPTIIPVEGYPGSTNLEKKAKPTVVTGR
jgi:hypothetical protein